jgi:hypothetical protein
MNSTLLHPPTFLEVAAESLRAFGLSFLSILKDGRGFAAIPTRNRANGKKDAKKEAKPHGARFEWMPDGSLVITVPATDGPVTFDEHLSNTSEDRIHNPAKKDGKNRESRPKLQVRTTAPCPADISETFGPYLDVNGSERLYEAGFKEGEPVTVHVNLYQSGGSGFCIPAPEMDSYPTANPATPAAPIVPDNASKLIELTNALIGMGFEPEDALARATESLRVI